MARCGERAVHDVARREVAAHRVDRYPARPCHVRMLFLVDRAGLAAAVVAAVAAHAVRRLGLVAMRAFAEADRLQRVVSPAFGRPGLRVSSLWIRHSGYLISRFARLEPFQRRQPRVVPPALARAGAVIEVRSAHRAQALAVVPAQRLHRQRKDRTAPASTAPDRSRRSRRNAVDRSSSSISRSASAFAAIPVCGMIPQIERSRRPALVNGSRQRLHGNSSVVFTVRPDGTALLSLKMSKASAHRRHDPEGLAVRGECRGR